MFHNFLCNPKTVMAATVGKQSSGSHNVCVEANAR